VETDGFVDGFVAGMGALRGAFFKPNTVFLPIPPDGADAPERRIVIERARDYDLGTILFADHPRAGLGRRQLINVWVRNASWEKGHEVAELDLLLLLAYKLQRNWEGRVRLLTVVESMDEKPAATAELHRLVDLARMQQTDVYAISGTFLEALDRAPQADVSLFGLPAEIDFDWMRRVVVARAARRSSSGARARRTRSAERALLGGVDLSLGHGCENAGRWNSAASSTSRRPATTGSGGPAPASTSRTARTPEASECW
jgi:hypothetical protein